VHRQWQNQDLPRDFQLRLSEAYHRTIFKNTHVFQALQRILGALSQDNVPVIPLKGVYLAEKVYGNIGLRGMIDIDLLVPRQQLSQALKVLQGSGYRPIHPFQIEAECRVRHHLPPLYKDGGHTTELHWTLAPPPAPFKIPIDRVWQNTHRGRLTGEAIQELTPEDLLLHLCLHAAYLDFFSTGLRPLCDIAWTVQTFQEQIDWQKLIRQARQWGVERCAWLALMVAVQLLQAPVPADLLESLQPSTDDLTKVGWAATQALNPSGQGGKLAAAWAPNPWFRRAALVLRLLFPAPQEMRPAYPRLARGLLWPIAYLLHLGIVIHRNWNSAWKLMRGDPKVRAAVEQREQVNRLVAWLASNHNSNRSIRCL
jgi:hypothetical protein